MSKHSNLEHPCQKVGALVEQIGVVNMIQDQRSIQIDKYDNIYTLRLVVVITTVCNFNEMGHSITI